jgi:putative zincin peptidase
MEPSDAGISYEIRYNPNFRPERSRHANVKRLVVDREPQLILKNHKTQDYFEIDWLTAAVWDLLDGKRSLTEIRDEIGKQHPLKAKPEILATRIRDAVIFLSENDCLRVTKGQPAKYRRVVFPSPLEIDVRLLADGNNSLTLLHRWIRRVLVRPLLWGSIIFIIVSGVIFARNFLSLLGNKQAFEVLGSPIVGFFYYFFVLIFPVVVVHEFAHGLALKHYGGKPAEIGTGLYYLSPFFYVDVSDSWTLEKWQRITVSMAGGISTFLIGGAAALIGFLAPLPANYSAFFTLLGFWCFYVMLLNLNPLFETDGYYALMDLVDMPDLRHDSFEYLKAKLLKFLGRHFDNTSEYSKKEKRILLSYSVVGLAWLTFFLYSSVLFLYLLIPDFGASAFRIYDFITNRQIIGSTALIVSFASVAYFGMTAGGFGLGAVQTFRSARRTRVKFVTVHNQRVGLLLNIPRGIPKHAREEFEKRIERTCSKFSSKYELIRTDTLLIAELGMGNVEKPLLEIETTMVKVESTFRMTYKKFLNQYEDSIAGSAVSGGRRATNLTKLLNRVSKEVITAQGSDGHTRTPKESKGEGNSPVNLLLSTFGAVWLFSLDPAEYDRISRAWIPHRIYEDLTAVGLHEPLAASELGYSLSANRLAEFVEKVEVGAKEVLAHPEIYQASAMLEPNRNRLTIFGRLERTEEKKLTSLCVLFELEEWINCLDFVTNEIFAKIQIVKRLAGSLAGDKRQFTDLAPGESKALKRNLDSYVSAAGLTEIAMDRAEKTLVSRGETVTKLLNNLETIASDFRIGLLETLVWFETAGLHDLLRKIQDARTGIHTIKEDVQEIEKRIRYGYERSEALYSKSKNRIMKLYMIPFVLSVSFLIYPSAPTPLFAMLTPSTVLIPPITIGVILAGLCQAIWALVYYFNWKKFEGPSGEASQSFLAIESLVKAGTEIAYPLLVVGIDAATSN